MSPSWCVLPSSQNQPKSSLIKIAHHATYMTLFTAYCYCPNGPDRRSASIGNMKGRYLLENLFTPENLYEIAGAIHKEIHEIINGMNRKFYTSVRGVESILNPGSG